MEICQVRYFLAICQERNFTRAAERCGVSQPTITKSIRVLERQLGGALFNRNPVELTERGQVVRPYLRRIAEAADLAFRALKESKHVHARDESLF
jgi:LysR family transcriptional regulator, hydrogen peroxide-inducible genes activator